MTTPDPHILTINGGSSSIKFALFACKPPTSEFSLKAGGCYLFVKTGQFTIIATSAIIHFAKPAT